MSLEACAGLHITSERGRSANHTSLIFRGYAVNPCAASFPGRCGELLESMVRAAVPLLTAELVRTHLGRADEGQRRRQIPRVPDARLTDERALLALSQVERLKVIPADGPTAPWWPRSACAWLVLGAQISDLTGS
jgi:hypothetical protein